MNSYEWYDYVNGHICKHLHALHMLNNQQRNSSNEKPIMLNEGMATILNQSPRELRHWLFVSNMIKILYYLLFV